ncbi:protrudin isoform X2 [Ambystoma mexicanum]|uniref:protrudin isoform X2 n=1 Tax=Ambystoma mexicanum TaxID=8296 RepID=UPI0037E76A20
MGTRQYPLSNAPCQFPDSISMQTAEKDGATVGVANGPEGSPTKTDQQPEPSIGSTKCQAFDLFNLVVSYKKLEIYLEPLKDTWGGVKYLIRWQMPVCSLLTCFAVNFMLLTLNEVAWFTTGSLLISVPALLGYLQEISQTHPSEQALARRKYHSVRREDLQKVKLSRQEAVAEFKSFLIHLDGLLNMFCTTCETIYRVLYWENSAVSFQFYGALLGSVCILYLLPLSWVLAILNSSLFFWNAEFYRVVTEYKAAHQQNSSPCSVETAPDATDSEGGASSDRTPTPTPTSTEDLSPGSVEEAEEAEQYEEFKDAIEEDDDISQGAVEYELLQDNGFMSKNEVIRNKVSKLTEKLRKRYPANSIATCTGCTATFSVLKKRRSCSNCGNSFCSRCCSFKVPKSFMGATAPDAQRETVFVCAPCNQALSKKE